ncbi:MAG: type II toxin-antitoxin system HicA family toxin [Methylacidiphilales bacterium]|nr:type II toxin-antitoxin system HicA family toxin [Candidatus Methylacidiphilales bacterium]
MKLPADVHGTDAVKALCRLGFTSDHQTGSHHIMRGRDRRIVVVPMHKPIKRGTLRGLIRQAGVNLDEFLGAL